MPDNGYGYGCGSGCGDGEVGVGGVADVLEWCVGGEEAVYEQGFLPGGYGEGWYDALQLRWQCGMVVDNSLGYFGVVVGLCWLGGAVEEDAEHYRRHDNDRQQAAISRTTTVNVFENEVEYVCGGE